jgi:hypothetical protein
MSHSNGHDDPPFPADPEMIEAIREVREAAAEAIREAFARNPDASPEQVNAVLHAQVSALNRRPQRDLAGLSPDQVQRLISDDWEGRGGAVRLNEAIAAERLKGARTFQNARVLLSYLQEQGAAKATATGNLNRATVAALMEQMDWRPGYLDELRRHSKVINESDAFPLHLLRVVAELAGLIKRRTAKYSLTRQGAAMLAEEKAGELFARLFRTTFRKLNLGYVDGLPEVPGFQSTVAFPLYRFGQVGGDWRQPGELLAGRVLLPFLRGELPPREYHDPLATMLETRLLRPLEGFGLVEQKEVPGGHRLIPNQAYRKSPLYDRFLRFHLPPTLLKARHAREA